jgi:hypothetical protein
MTPAIIDVAEPVGSPVRDHSIVGQKGHAWSDLFVLI